MITILAAHYLVHEQAGSRARWHNSGAPNGHEEQCPQLRAVDVSALVLLIPLLALSVPDPEPPGPCLWHEQLRQSSLSPPCWRMTSPGCLEAV